MKAIVKHDSGKGALLCNGCRTVIAIGLDHDESRGHFCLPCTTNPVYEIRYGLGGGYGGCGEWEPTTAATLAHAESWAYECACEYFESYGLGDDAVNEAREEDPDLTFEECEEIYQECRNSWIEWDVRITTGKEMAEKEAAIEDERREANVACLRQRCAIAQEEIDKNKEILASCKQRLKLILEQ